MSWSGLDERERAGVGRPGPDAPANVGEDRPQGGTRDAGAASPGRVAVVIVNWNGWQDTVECLESLFRGDVIPDIVIVCDNQSSDGSLERIREWAEGAFSVYLPLENPLRRFVVPGVGKPIPVVEYDRETAEGGGTPEGEAARLVLIRTGGNLGFAGGNNVALRYLLARGWSEPIWLLNPDTVVEPGAARELLAVLAADERVGMCGSTVRYYERPDVIQALGGAVHTWWLAYPRHIGDGLPADAIALRSKSDRSAERMTYVYAASMMISPAFLREVGLMDESYFLFFEELDLAMRGRRSGFRLAHAPGSVVYHRGSASVSREGFRSVIADYHFLRNRLRVTWRYRPVALPGAFAAVLAALVKRAWRGDRERVRTIMKMMMRSWRESSARGSAAERGARAA